MDATAPPHAIVASNVIYARLANRAQKLVLGPVAALEVRSQCARVEAPSTIGTRFQRLLLPDAHRLAVYGFELFRRRLAGRHVGPVGQRSLLTFGLLLFLLQPSLRAARRHDAVPGAWHQTPQLARDTCRGVTHASVSVPRVSVKLRASAGSSYAQHASVKCQLCGRVSDSEAKFEHRLCGDRRKWAPPALCAIA